MSDFQYEKIGSPIIRLVEECSELIHILCKVDRFGWNNYHPKDPERVKNKELVLAEMEDVEKIMIELHNLIKKM